MDTIIDNVFGWLVVLYVVKCVCDVIVYVVKDSIDEGK